MNTFFGGVIQHFTKFTWYIVILTWLQMLSYCIVHCLCKLRIACTQTGAYTGRLSVLRIYTKGSFLPQKQHKSKAYISVCQISLIPVLCTHPHQSEGVDCASIISAQDVISPQHRYIPYATCAVFSHAKLTKSVSSNTTSHNGREHYLYKQYVEARLGRMS